MARFSDGGRALPDQVQILGRTTSVVEPDLIHGGGQTGRRFAMEMRECLIRKAEPPGDRVKGCLFFAGAPLTSRIRRRRGAAMRRILVDDDDDMHTRPAKGLWLKQCGFRVAITNGGERGSRRGDRRVSAGSGTATKTCHSARRHCWRTAEHFCGERQYRLNCQGTASSNRRFRR